MKCSKCGKEIPVGAGYYNYPSGVNCRTCGSVHVPAVDKALKEELLPMAKAINERIMKMTKEQSRNLKGESISVFAEITKEQSDRLKMESIRRMRWRLWFAFRDSKYERFRKEVRDEIHPNYDNIKQFCLEHWKVEIKDMTESELKKYIAIVAKWK